MLPLELLPEAYQAAHSLVKDFQADCRSFNPRDWRSRPRDRALLFIKLCQLKADIERPQRSAQRKEGQRRALEERAAVARLELDRLIKELKADPERIKARYVDCNPAWIKGAPSRHACDHIAGIWSSLTVADGNLPISGTTVRTALTNLRKNTRTMPAAGRQRRTRSSHQ
jgi:hypothetical protein